MFDRQRFENSRPDGFPVLEIVDPEAPREQPRLFVPLRRSELAGHLTGPLADLRLTQVFAFSRSDCDRTIEALYRFPLPGDAAVTGIHAAFGKVEIHAELKERAHAEQEYEAARTEGRQAALATRESPDVFTLRISGIEPDQEVRITTSYVQLARPEKTGWTLRIPLTTAPRYVREDERGSRHAQGQPLAILRDPGHRFTLDLELADATDVRSSTHALDVAPAGTGQHVRLKEREVVPDRDCVLSWSPKLAEQRTAVRMHWHRNPQDDHLYFLALVTPPAAPSVPLPREVVLLVDHSGSMSGAKWTAADWAVTSFLSGLSERDSFALGLFHDTTRWLSRHLCLADARNQKRAIAYLERHKESGGTNLGVALEQALDIDAAPGTQSRHVLIVTDAEVSDSGRILRLVDHERSRAYRRRVSVLCIDAAPNSLLAQELAERGGGVARFLTSNPEEEDITTALEETLEEWSAPVNTRVRLEIDRPAVEAAGREVAANGAWSYIDLGDLPASRSLWVAGRVPASGDTPITVRLTSAQGELDPGEPQLIGSQENPALKALFGARKVLALEFLSHSYLDDDQVWEQLERLGYRPEQLGTLRPGKPQKVYAENAREELSASLRALLVREALEFGLASAETAFVAVRAEAGNPSTETVVIGNALPAGWSEGVADLATAGGMYDMCMMSASAIPMAPPPAAPPQRFSVGGIFRGRSARNSVDYFRVDAGAGPATLQLWSGVPDFEQHEALLFDGKAGHEGQLPDAGTLSEIRVRLDEPSGSSAINPELAILLYVDDPAVPRARIRLAELVRQGGKRPLNVRFRADQLIRVVLSDPQGAWAAEAPSVEVSVVCS